MIRRIARPQVAIVLGLVIRISGRKRPQTYWCPEAFLTVFRTGFHCSHQEQGGQRNGKQLVGAATRIVGLRFAIYDVEQITRRLRTRNAG